MRDRIPEIAAWKETNLLYAVAFTVIFAPLAVHLYRRKSLG